MKKKNIKYFIIGILIFLIIITIIILKYPNNHLIESPESFDYSKCNFMTDINWVRQSEHDTETIYFSSDGSFYYSCACGNPVNDSDLCETYIYDAENKIIKLECFELTENIVTEIKVISYDKETLKLDFNGDIREFKISN